MTANETILLVEDDFNDVLLIQRAFRKANLTYPLQLVEDGESAILYLKGEGSFTDRDRYPLPRLILLDMKLPRKSGLEVLLWVREEPRLKCLPVVMLTSSREITDIKQAYMLGANSYLVKPVSFDALLEMIKTLNLYWLLLNQTPTIQ